MKRTTRLDLVCLLLFLLLLAVMTLAAPWAREQKQHFFNVAPEMLLTLWVRPGLLLLGGYCFQWLLAGFLAGEPRLKAGAKKPLLVVCALLTLSWPALVLLPWASPCPGPIPWRCCICGRTASFFPSSSGRDGTLPPAGERGSRP